MKQLFDENDDYKPEEMIDKQPQLPTGLTNSSAGQLRAVRQQYYKRNVQALIATLSADKPNLSKPDEVRKAVAQYFLQNQEMGMLPSVSGLANRLGLGSRHVLYNIVNGGDALSDGTRLPNATLEVIRVAYGLIEQSMEQGMLDGEIQPIVGIFLGKQHFGYSDKGGAMAYASSDDSDSATLASKYGAIADS